MNPRTILFSAGCALLLFASFTASNPLFAQGCVAVRGGGQCSLGHLHEQSHLGAGNWQISLGYRWLHSDRHFRGDHEEKHRKALGTEVINDSHFFDLSAVYSITPRFEVGLTLPFVYSDRSSLYEHDRRNRYHTSAGGLGDVRLTFYGWMLDPQKMPKGNLLFGIGPKFPTGDYKATDTFYSAAGPVVRPVDQSIQPGDGGWGFTTELFGYLELAPRTYGYVQGFYLFNPENVNNVSTQTGTRRGNPFEQVMSIPDQYMGRAGVSYEMVPSWGLSLSLGGRIEGVPVEDVFGKSDGFRRPGYAVSVEPGIALLKNKWSLNLTAPVAVYRNRERSVPDKRWTEQSGIFRHGDAAFADYQILASISRRF
jgi:hypothetical protein